MTTEDAEQLTLDGLAPRKRRKRAPATHTPASHNPIAQVVLDVQATHLGQTFDYLVDADQDEHAQPGVLVIARFGGQRVNGIIWGRAAVSDVPMSSMRYLERVVSPNVLVPASLRDDITRIADAYGGTRANIIRFAVPPRVAKVEREQRLAASFAPGTTSPRLNEGVALGYRRIAASYENAARLNDALASPRFQAFVFDPLPGVSEWERDVAWMVARAVASSKPAVVTLPTMREVNDLLRALHAYGMTRFSPSANGLWSGDVAVLNAETMPAADRYRAYLAVALGQSKVVIGTRAASYAPVEGPALFVIVDDAVYQNMDGFMPYPQARGVMRLRAESHQGVFVAVSNARSAVSQWEAVGPGTRQTPVSGFAQAIHPLASKVKDATPWVRWLNRDELTRLTDPMPGARVPHTAVSVLSKALHGGPVLLSIPTDDHAETLSCATCRRQARCLRCTGPLQRVHEGTSALPRCRWCGAAAVGWHCSACSGERMRVVHVGAAGTATELTGLFRGVPVVISGKTHGLVEWVPCKPMIVIASPGFEPRVRPISAEQGVAGREYRAVAILDAWNSLYRVGIDARVDTLTDWMRAVSLCAPRSRGGQALILGDADSTVAQSLMLWDTRLLAAKELEEREQTGMPPTVAAACVWGRRDAVMQAMRGIGVLGGDWAMCPTAVDELPGMLGPVPMAQPSTMDARILEETADRVKVVVRVPQARRGELAERLRREVSRHVATRTPGELRFRVDPKDLI